MCPRVEEVCRRQHPHGRLLLLLMLLLLGEHHRPNAGRKGLLLGGPRGATGRIIRRAAAVRVRS